MRLAWLTFRKSGRLWFQCSGRLRLRNSTRRPSNRMSRHLPHWQDEDLLLLLRRESSLRPRSRSSRWLALYATMRLSQGLCVRQVLQNYRDQEWSYCRKSSGTILLVYELAPCHVIHCRRRQGILGWFRFSIVSLAVSVSGVGVGSAIACMIAGEQD